MSEEDLALLNQTADVQEASAVRKSACELFDQPFLVSKLPRRAEPFKPRRAGSLADVTANRLPLFHVPKVGVDPSPTEELQFDRSGCRSPTSELDPSPHPPARSPILFLDSLRMRTAPRRSVTLRKRCLSSPARVRAHD